MRLRVDSNGSLSIVDPGFNALDLLQSIDPDFGIRQSELPGFISPRFLMARNIGCGVSHLSGLAEEALWDIHDDIMCNLRRDNHYGLSFLDLKIELAHRILSNCHLCSHRCGVDRIHGEKGICGLGADAIVAGSFAHIAEEPQINPSLLISLAGCGLHCPYCQQWELLDPEYPGERLDADLWDRIDVEGARSISFIGGNPDESLYSILRLLREAPADLSLPVVWNCNGYASPETARLLDGIVDCYIPDFKYGNARCSQIFNAPGYSVIAEENIRSMLMQEVPVIVRILVLPGHYECCHIPVLEVLASMKGEYLYVSVRNQYWPDYQMTFSDGAMSRRTPPEEAKIVLEKAYNLGLQVIE